MCYIILHTHTHAHIYNQKAGDGSREQKTYFSLHILRFTHEEKIFKHNCIYNMLELNSHVQHNDYSMY